MTSHQTNIHYAVIVLCLMIPVVSSGSFTVLACLSRIKTGIHNQFAGSAASARIMVTMVRSASGALRLNTSSGEQWSQHSSRSQSFHFVKVEKRENILKIYIRFSLSQTRHLLNQRSEP
jgi:hypothetical protein